MYDPLYFNVLDARTYIESPYINLRRNIIKTRKLNEHSESKDASRFHATMDLMNYLADPTSFESERLIQNTV